MMLRTTLLAACLVLLAGCGMFAKTQDDHRQELVEKTNAIWTAKKSGNCGPQYDYATESFKKHVDRDKFVARCNMRIKSYTIDRVEFLSETQALVYLTYVINPMGFEFTIPTKTHWLLEHGEWRVEPSSRLVPMMQ